MKNYIFVLIAFQFINSACADDKEILLNSWDKISPLLISEAKKNNDCTWKLERQDVIDVALDGNGFKERLLSEKKLSCNSSSLYLVTFSSYCGGSETDAFVSARILDCDQEYKIFSLSLTEG